MVVTYHFMSAETSSFPSKAIPKSLSNWCIFIFSLECSTCTCENHSPSNLMTHSDTGYKLHTSAVDDVIFVPPAAPIIS